MVLISQMTQLIKFNYLRNSENKNKISKISKDHRLYSSKNRKVGI